MKTTTLLFVSLSTFRKLEILADKRYTTVVCWFEQKGIHHSFRIVPYLKKTFILDTKTLAEKIIDKNDFFTKTSVNFKILK